MTCVLPTEMYKIGIPFLYGPVSGGENTPKIIRYPMGMKDRVIETVRSAVQRFFCMTPNFYRTMEGANIILATTEETRDLVPDKYKEKTFIFQSIGLQRDIFFPAPEEKPDRIPRFLMAGRMLYWKGFQLGIKVFIATLESGFVGELVVLGDTECNHSYEKNKEILQTLCGKYLNTNIKFVEKVEYGQMKAFYDGFDVLINCSLRDSGCFVVMEAMSRALPLIVVNTGGPKVNTTSDCAIKIEPAPMKEMIEEIQSAIVCLGGNKALRKEMGEAGRQYAIDEFEMSQRMAKMNHYYELVKTK